MKHKKIGRRLTTGVMSSANDNWRTPDKEFKALNTVFAFGFDAAADSSNTKRKFYLSPNDDALQDDDEVDGKLDISCSWLEKIRKKYKIHNHLLKNFTTAWLNPPYGDKVKPFIEMAIRQNEDFDLSVVTLCSARTETKWFRTANAKARYRIELYRRLPFTEPGCYEGHVFERYNEKTCPPGREDKIGQIVVVDGVNMQKKSQPAFPSVVFVFTNQKTQFPVYDLMPIGYVIDLALQRQQADSQMIVRKAV